MLFLSDTPTLHNAARIQLNFGPICCKFSNNFGIISKFTFIMLLIFNFFWRDGGVESQILEINKLKPTEIFFSVWLRNR